MLKWKQNVCAHLQPLSPSYILEINPWQSPELEFLKNILHQIPDSIICIFLASSSLQTYLVSEYQTHVINRVEYVQLHTLCTKPRLTMHLPENH